MTTAPSTPPPPPGEAVTRQRRELKFIVPHGDPGKLARVLEANLTPIAFGEREVSEVSSIYFDDDELTSCRESLAGVNRRTKVRLRWYDRGQPSGDAYVELKHRRGETVSKTRTLVTIGEDLSYARILDDMRSALAPADAAWLCQRPRPVAIVAYRRRHFLHRPTGARVTLDYDLCAFDQFGRRAVYHRFPVAVEGLAVIEAKVPAGCEAMTRQLLYPLTPRLSRCSKYVHCCDRFGWCRLADTGD